MTVLIGVRCNDCGHTQTAEAINPVIDGDTLISCLLGSAGWYCNDCDSSNVEHTHVTYSEEEN